MNARNKVIIFFTYIVIFIFFWEIKHFQLAQLLKYVVKTRAPGVETSLCYFLKCLHIGIENTEEANNDNDDKLTLVFDLLLEEKWA